MQSEAPARRAKRADVRDSILSAAAQLFGERGVAGATMDEIGARAGFTKGAVYSNFATKDELVARLIDQQIDVQAAGAATQLRPEMSLEEVRIGMRAQLGAMSPERRLAFALLTEIRLYAERRPELWEVFRSARTRAHASVTAIIEAYVSHHPEIDVGLRPRALAQLVIAIMIGTEFDHPVADEPTAGDLIAEVLGALAR